jgi:hypothetical protein
MYRDVQHKCSSSGTSYKYKQTADVVLAKTQFVPVEWKQVTTLLFHEAKLKRHTTTCFGSKYKEKDG